MGTRRREERSKEWMNKGGRGKETRKKEKSKDEVRDGVKIVYFKHASFLTVCHTHFHTNMPLYPNPLNQSMFWLGCCERIPTVDFILTGYRPHTGKFQPVSPQVGHVSMCKSLEGQWEQAIIVEEGPGSGGQAHASKPLQPLKELYVTEHNKVREHRSTI